MLSHITSLLWLISILLTISKGRCTGSQWAQGMLGRTLEIIIHTIFAPKQTLPFYKSHMYSYYTVTDDYCTKSDYMDLTTYDEWDECTCTWEVIPL